MPSATFPPYTPPRRPGAQNWAHPHFTIAHLTTPEENLITRSRLHDPTGLRLFVLSRPTADSPLGFYALFNGSDMRPVESGLTRGYDVPDALWTSLLAGLSHVSKFPGPRPLLILLPNRAILPYLTNLGKHRYLPQTAQFTELLDDSTSESSPTEIRLFSPKWRNMPYALALAAAMTDPPSTLPPTPPSRRERAFSQWQSDYDLGIIPRRGVAWVSVTRPEGTTPPPFTLGALLSCNRRYFSTCMQLTTRHCFDAGYSNRFRASAEDEVRCPCNFSQHLDGSAVGGGPMRGRTDTEAGSQGNAAGTRLDFEALQALYLNPSALLEDQGSPTPSQAPSHTHLYTLHHVLTSCPLTATFRSKFLRNCSVDELFRSELGAQRLCRFLHFSQTLLRPLPPRPDPP